MREWHTLVGNVDALRARGVDVLTLIAAHRNETLVRRGSTYRTVKDGRVATILRRPAISRVASAWKPDVVHVQGMGYPVHTWWLQKAISCPVVIQDHASAAPAGWRRFVHRIGFANIRRVAFTAAAQAVPFVEGGILPNDVVVHEVLEAATDLQAQPVTAARELTGIHGKPAILWVGHLNHNKDPITVVKAFVKAASRLPDPNLWLCYRDDELEADLRALIAPSPELSTRVHFVGPVPHESMVHYYSAADVFVLASHREGSGYSLIEALACGTEPVVTDIPSFRRITRDGRVGALFPVGDSDAMARLLVSVASGDRSQVKRRTRAHFEQHLAWDAIGAELETMYRDMLNST